jgi:hypothetical protein
MGTLMPLEEARSWIRPVKVKPIPTYRPTNADLATGFNELHLCHEDTKAKVERILSALGLDEGAKPVAGLSSSRGAFWRTFFAVASAIGSLSAVGFAVRFGIAVTPGARAIAQSLWTALATGRL